MVSFVAAVIAFMFPNQIITFMGNAIGIERYVQYGTNAVQGGASTFIILIELLSVFCFLALDSDFLKEHPTLRNLYTMIPLLTFFGPLIRSNGSMIRICMYFYLYLCILVPFGIDRFLPKKRQSIAYAIVVFVLVFLVLRGGAMDYHFMWDTFY